MSIFRTHFVGSALCGLLVLWQPLRAHQPHDPMSVVALSPNYANDQTVFVATSAITMPLPVSEFLPMISTNGGFTFNVLSGLPNQQMNSIAVSPGYATDGTVFMGGFGGLWRSTDSAKTWAAVGGAPLSAGIVEVVVAPDFPTSGVAFAITNRNVYKSTNHGQTWQAVSAPNPLPSNLSSLAISSNYAADSTIAAGTVASGIYISTNAGQSWTLSTSGLTLPQVSCIAFSTGYATDHTIMAGTEGSGFYKSTNSGTSWTQSNSGLTDTKINAMALSPSFAGDNVLWVATATGGVFASHNRGGAWTLPGTVPRPLSPQTNSHYVTVAAGKGPTAPALFVGMFEGLWSSTNGGALWSYCDTLPTRLVRQLQISPSYSSDQTVFASTYGGGTLWSFDGGSTWSFRDTALQDPYTDANAFATNYSTSKMVWIGTTSGLDRISGTATAWSPMHACGKTTFPRSMGVSANFAMDQTIFIGTHAGPIYPPTVTCGNGSFPNRGLFMSVDAGQDWLGTGLQNIAVDAIGMSPNYPTDHTLFAGSSLTGLYKTTDGGNTFTPITIVQGDNGTLPVVCSPNYGSDQTVFAGTSHSGIFRSADGGAHWTQIPNTSVLTAFSFAISPNFANDHTMFIGTLQQGLMKYDDSDQSLTQLTNGLPTAFASAVAISNGYATDGTVWTANYLGLYKSTNGGSSWTYMKEPARQEEQRQFGSGAFSSIIYTGTWNIVGDKGASTIQYASTSQTGATATLTFLGSGAEWIGLKSSTGGTATVTLDGTLDKTVNLQSSTKQEQASLWKKTGLPCAPHTVTITVTSAATLSVVLDAMNTWQDTCSFIISPGL